MATSIQAIPTDPRKLLAYLEWSEVDSSRAPDCRRILRDERVALASALRGGDGAAITAARDEALRVAKEWAAY